MFDLNIIKNFYKSLPNKIRGLRKEVDRPLTLSEKILYAHLYDFSKLTKFHRGLSYANFSPDRVAMQDATAQMALLQFMMAGREKVAVPSTVHCDHLIQAKINAGQDLLTAKKNNDEVFSLSLIHI